MGWVEPGQPYPAAARWWCVEGGQSWQRCPEWRPSGNQYVMRAACECGSLTGTVKRKRGQDCVYCESCGKWQYNAPRTESAGLVFDLVEGAETTGEVGIRGEGPNPA